MTYTREQYRERCLGLLSGEFLKAPKFNDVLTRIVDKVFDELVVPIQDFEDWPNIENLQGPALEFVGSGLGFLRPGRIVVQDRESFGFAGTERHGGVTFEQGPFFSPEIQNFNRELVYDDVFRVLLRWRIRAMMSGPTWGFVNNVFLSSEPELHGFQNGAVTVSGEDVSVVRGDIADEIQTVLWEFISEPANREISDLIFPKGAGLNYIFSTS